MKRTALPAALALILAGALASPAFAQTAAPDPQTATTAPARTPDPHKQAVRLAKELNLTPDQTAKLEPVFADRDQKIAALKANTSLAPKDAKKQMRQIQMSTQQQLGAILTPDQMEEMKALRKGGKGQGQVQPAA